MKRTALGSALALSALISAQTAQAQKHCVEPEDAADAVVYMMPTAYESTLSACENEFNSDSFLTSDAGRAFIDGFRGQQDQRWSGAYRFFKVFIQKETKGDDAMGEMLANLPEEALRPLIDGLLGQIIAKEIKPNTCGKIDRVVELLSPLPPENIAGLMSFILPEVDIKDPPVCGTTRPSPPPPVIELLPAPPPPPPAYPESGSTK